MSDRIDILRKNLEEIKEQISALQDAVAVKPEYGMGKGDPAVTQWEFDRAMLEKLESRARKLQSTIARLELGHGNLCERCGKPIHPDRLAVLPDTTLCVQCAKERRVEER